jgi:hypothetical protein
MRHLTEIDREIRGFGLEFLPPFKAFVRVFGIYLAYSSRIQQDIIHFSIQKATQSFCELPELTSHYSRSS